MRTIAVDGAGNVYVSEWNLPRVVPVVEVRSLRERSCRCLDGEEAQSVGVDPKTGEVYVGGDQRRQIKLEEFDSVGTRC